MILHHFVSLTFVSMGKERKIQNGTTIATTAEDATE